MVVSIPELEQRNKQSFVYPFYCYSNDSLSRYRGAGMTFNLSFKTHCGFAQTVDGLQASQFLIQ